MDLTKKSETKMEPQKAETPQKAVEPQKVEPQKVEPQKADVPQAVLARPKRVRRGLDDLVREAEARLQRLKDQQEQKKLMGGSGKVIYLGKAIVEILGITPEALCEFQSPEAAKEYILSRMDVKAPKPSERLA